MLPLALLAAAQLAALAVLVARLARGRDRRPPVEPLANADRAPHTTVSVIVPTLNEVHRLGRCLEGLHVQGAPLAEVIVVDSRSTDGTVEMVDAMARRDGRFRRVTDDPLPAGCVGRPWALDHGFRRANGEWVLGVDADTVPEPGMVAATVAAAVKHGYDAVSFAPRIVARSAGARWLQPALLATLVYRSGPAGADAPAEQTMANGQCFLMKRAVLEQAGGYGVARSSFCDDITVARHLATSGARVGFLDGPSLFSIEMYTSFAETWREWGRSLGMKDATRPTRQWLDIAFLALAQGAPALVLASLALAPAGVRGSAAWWTLLGINAMLVVLRVLLLAASRHSFARRGLAYWLSPLADPLAAARIFTSTVRRPRRWRGRAYGREVPARAPAAR
ncbi:MAG: glycosyltransferase family 2 protein [Gemmatimonadaceae bacterium]